MLIIKSGSCNVIETIHSDTRHDKLCYSYKPDESPFNFNNEILFLFNVKKIRSCCKKTVYVEEFVSSDGCEILLDVMLWLNYNEIEDMYKDPVGFIDNYVITNIDKFKVGGFYYE